MSSSHDITLTPQGTGSDHASEEFPLFQKWHIYPGRTVERSQCRSEHFYGTHDSTIDAEQARADKRFNRLMKEAHLRYPAADLDETIYCPERQLDTHQ